MDSDDSPIEVSKVSNSSNGISLRLTLPKPIADKLRIMNGNFLGFYEESGMEFVKIVK